MPLFSPGPARRPWEPALPVIGGTPILLPLVSMVAVNSLSATGGTLVGSVNTQGLTGSAWFVYGTTPQFGATTTTQALSASSTPQTLTVAVSGLTTGAIYYVAVVGQTAGGTVTSAPITFVPATPQPVTSASNVPDPVGTPTVAIPHWRFPISFSVKTGVGVVEQDTLDEVFSNVQAIANWPLGACPELPTQGVPELTFGTAPLDPRALVQAIQAQEPRATEQAVSQALGGPNAGGWQINLTTKYAGSGQ